MGSHVTQQPLPPSVLAVVRNAAMEFGISPAQILGRDQARYSVRARYAAIRELYLRGYSTPQIGRWLNRHHTTVIYALRGRKGIAEPPSPIPVPDLSGEWAI
jgi:chromosomal replication initiation ATPase DnaA